MIPSLFQIGKVYRYPGEPDRYLCTRIEVASAVWFQKINDAGEPAVEYDPDEPAVVLDGGIRRLEKTLHLMQAEEQCPTE